MQRNIIQVASLELIGNKYHLRVSNRSAQDISWTQRRKSRHPMEANNEKQQQQQLVKDANGVNKAVAEFAEELPQDAGLMPPAPAPAAAAAAETSSSGASSSPPETSSAADDNDDQRPVHLRRYKSPYSSSKQQNFFPGVLRAVLSCTDEEIASAIAWQPNGKCFVIKSPEKFEKVVMPRFFGKGKYSSFVRKLNRWGFRQIVGRASPDVGAFQQELFLRDQPELAQGMKTKKTGSVRGMNLAKRRQNALESLATSNHANGPHGNLALAALASANSSVTSAFLPDYILQGSLQQRQQQLSLMGMSFATGAGLGGVAPGAAATAATTTTTTGGGGGRTPVPDYGGIYYYGPAAAPSLFPPGNPLAGSATTAAAPQVQTPHMPVSAHFAGGTGGAHAYAQPTPTAFGFPPTAAMNPNAAAAAAPSYEQLMAKNQMLEAALQAASVQPLAPSEASSKAPAIAAPPTTTNGATSEGVGDQKPSADSAPAAPTSTSSTADMDTASASAIRSEAV